MTLLPVSIKNLNLEKPISSRLLGTSPQVPIKVFQGNVQHNRLSECQLDLSVTELAPVTAVACYTIVDVLVITTVAVLIKCGSSNIFSGRRNLVKYFV